MQHIKIKSKNFGIIKLKDSVVREIFLSCDEERSVLTIVYIDENNESRVIGRQCDFGVVQATKLQRSLKRLIAIFLSEEQNFALDKHRFLEEICEMFEREVVRVYGE